MFTCFSNGRCRPARREKLDTLAGKKGCELHEALLVRHGQQSALYLALVGLGASDGRNDVSHGAVGGVDLRRATSETQGE